MGQKSAPPTSPIPPFLLFKFQLDPKIAMSQIEQKWTADVTETYYTTCM